MLECPGTYLKGKDKESFHVKDSQQCLTPEVCSISVSLSNTAATGYRQLTALEMADMHYKMHRDSRLCSRTNIKFLIDNFSTN